MISQRFSQIFCFHGTAHTRSILILLHQQRKGFQRKWSHFPGSGRQSQIMQTTIRCHCHTATTPQPQICPREKNLPEKKQMPKEIKIAQDKKCLRKKLPRDDVAPATTPQPQISEHWYVSSKRWDFTTKRSKRRGKDPIPHIRNILHKHDYEQTLLLSSQYFHFMVAKHASFLGRTFALETNSIQ